MLFHCRTCGYSKANGSVSDARKQWNKPLREMLGFFGQKTKALGEKEERETNVTNETTLVNSGSKEEPVM